MELEFCEVRMCNREATVKLTVLKGLSALDDGKELLLCNEHIGLPGLIKKLGLHK